jgi:hypothetical protein
MLPIDRPFRFTLDFVLVWALLTVAAVFLIRRVDIGPWYSEAAAVALLSLFTTFLLYGPVLLARQALGSGSRGWLASRVLLSVVMVVAVLLGGMWLLGFYTGFRGHLLAVAFSFLATFYLHFKLRSEVASGA